MADIDRIVSRAFHKLNIIDRKHRDDMGEMNQVLDYITDITETAGLKLTQKKEKTELDDYVSDKYGAVWDKDTKTYLGTRDKETIQLTVPQVKALKVFDEYSDQLKYIEPPSLYKDPIKKTGVKSVYQPDYTLEEYVEEYDPKGKKRGKKVKVSEKQWERKKDKADKGRFGDTEIMKIDGKDSHVSSFEAQLIKTYGKSAEDWIITEANKNGGPTINPKTGLPEYFSFASFAGALGKGKGGGFSKIVGALGGPWGQLAMGIVGGIIGSAKKAKAAKKKADALATEVKHAEKEHAQTGATAVSDVEDLAEDFSTAQTGMAASFGESAEDVVAQEESLVGKTRGLDTGTVVAMVEEGERDIQESYQQQIDKLTTGYERTGTDYKRDVENTMENQQMSIKKLKEEEAYWRKKGKKKWYHSDKRLKHNIELVGKSPKGINIYEFEYINKKYGPDRYRGVLSDEVSFAAIKDGYGFEFVDYSHPDLDVDFERVK